MEWGVTSHAEFAAMPVTNLESMWHSEFPRTLAGKDASGNATVRWRGGGARATGEAGTRGRQE
eukprot:13255865-Alexandrium_andersonii.AAC.1